MRKRLTPLLLLAVWARQIAGGAVLYVDVNSTNPVAPYTNWATAAVTIQDAVDAAAAADRILVAAGSYQTGMRYAAGVSNRVAVTKAVRIESVSGPDATIIEGVQAGNTSNSVRCVYLADGAMLIGFTLTNGAVFNSFSGGGVCGQSTTAWVSNCVVLGNWRSGACTVTLLDCGLLGNTQTQTGGGAFSCNLTNCTLSGNSSTFRGGGAAQCLMSHCTLSDNYASAEGGGTSGGTLYDCVLSANSAASGGGASSATLTNCLLINNSAGNFGYGGGADSSHLTNCTLISNSATYGGGSSSSTLSGCSLTGNSVSQNGGGANASVLFNCLITSNTAAYGAGTFQGTATNCLITGNNATSGGGGCYGGTVQRGTISYNTAIFGGGASSAALIACAVLTNSAFSSGGGVTDGTLNSCVLMGNSANVGGAVATNYPGACFYYNCTMVANHATNMGGGAYYGDLYNCILYYNDAPTDPNISGSTNINHCCTLPLPATGVGNITNAPTFVDLAAGNLDLPPGSLLINAGSNAYVTNNSDFLGRPRISAGVVDIGAYEFQALDPFHTWLQQFGLATDGSADYLDSDRDGMNNWQEWIAGTNPTNAASVLQIQSATVTSPGRSVAVAWLSTTNRLYFLQRSTNLQAGGFATIQTNISGLAGTTTFTDTNAAAGPAFYRVGTHN